tara:strand:+ start:37 stop:534 length:498 start_codon:yes stop_codon:yes gene_type:complete
MFNTAGSAYRFNNNKILGGYMMGDYDSHKTLFAGPDPADTNRVLVRKLVQISDNKWAFEEARITPSETEGGNPTVHTTLHRLGWFNINEPLTEKELAMRLQYRAVPNVIGFSMFLRPYASGSRSSFTIVENSLIKGNNYRWAEWFRDLQDRRSIAAYLKMRWALN